MNLIPSVAPVLAAHAANSVLLGLAISALAWLALNTMARHNSAARFAVLYSALLTIVALLFFSQLPHTPILESSYSLGFTVPATWAVYLLYLWGIAAFAGMIRIASGLWRLRRLRRSFIPLDLPVLYPVLEQRRLLSKRKVELFHSSEIRVPAAIGFFRPSVVLPSWSLEELSPEELNAAVFHEFAHVDRWDDWTNLAQKLIRALLFFHPAVWWLDSHLAIEREMSCDDAVVAQTGGPERYAQCLVSLAEKSFLKRPMSLVQAAVGRMKQTALRIGRILNGKQRNATSAWKPAFAAMATFSAVGLVAVGHLPQLISFQAPAQSESVAIQNNHLASAVIPAAMHMQSADSHIAVGTAVSTPARVRPIRKHPAASNRSEELLARDVARRASVVNASAKYPTADQFMYVVMETRDYDDSGIVRVTTSVWRLRLAVPAPMRAESATPPHST